MGKKRSGGEEEFIELPKRYTRKELDRLYRAVPLRNQCVLLLRRYFAAMANLYGVIPLRRAKSILFSYEPDLVTEEEFWAFAEIARHEARDFYLLADDELYSGMRKKRSPEQRKIVASVCLMGEDIGALEELQKGKPYFCPEKEELFKYAEPLYYEPSAEAEEMLSFLRDCCGGDEDRVEYIFEFFIYMIRHEDKGIEGVYEFLELNGIVFQSDKELNSFLQAYNGLHNATRMPCNHGFTPREMSNILRKNTSVEPTVSFGETLKKMLASGEIEVEDVRRQLLSVDLPNEAIRLGFLKELDALTHSPGGKRETVGRSDPCPCGSGKKYKHCHGKCS